MLSVVLSLPFLVSLASVLLMSYCRICSYHSWPLCAVVDIDVMLLSFLGTMFCCRYCPCCYYVVIIPGYYFLSFLFLLLLCCYHSWPLILAVVVMVVLITSCQPSQCCCCSRTLSFSRKQSWCCRSPSCYTPRAATCRRCSHCRASQRSSGRCLLLGGCSPSPDCNCKSFHRSKPKCPRKRCQ